jgi:peroxisomal enoyl-CoA hydratase 2
MPTKPLEELQAQVGESVQTVENLEIEAGKVTEFARSLRDDNPIFHDEEAAREAGYDDIPAPLTFTRVAYFPRHRPDGIDADLGFDLGLREGNVLHGEQEYEYERPLVVGDVLSGTTTLVDVSQSEGSRGGTMTFCVYETKYRDQDGDLVLTERVTRIETGGDAGEDDG